MAKKKPGISELIKSDMSRRSIGEEAETTEAAEPVSDAAPPPQTETLFDDTPQKPVKKAARPVKAAELAVEKADKTLVPAHTAELLNALAAQAEAAGLREEPDWQRLNLFLQDQAARYLRGFNAARRFHRN